jgi:two-component system, NarL family, nitrate/nitrite response regulator NarL
MRRPVRVLVADDHVPTRAGVRSALESDGFEVCGEARDAAGAVRAVRIWDPDVCLMDAQMAGAIAAAAEVTNSRPRTAVVMLTDDLNEGELLEVLRAGAIGYLPKDMDRSRLPFALRDAVHGAMVIPRRLVNEAVHTLRERPDAHEWEVPGANLSRREFEVLDLVRSGQGTGEIAESLSLSPVTVRRHISSAVRKLGVPDREAAAQLLVRARRG